MRVRFTCEKCGFVTGVLTLLPGVSRDEQVREFMDDSVGECPNCAKLTYGPLTEEMVAEALELANELSRGDPYTPLCRQFLRQARFVLRLLNATDGGVCYFKDDQPNWRDWLLDLARHK